MLLDVCGFAGGGWSLDEVDGGVGVVLPAVLAGAVDSLVVAVGAGCAEVGGVPPWAALAGGDDVVDLGGEGGASFGLDLAGVLVAFEDLFSDASPWAAVFGFFGHVLSLVVWQVGHDMRRLRHPWGWRCAGRSSSGVWGCLRRTAP